MQKERIGKVYVDQSERRSSRFNQSEPSSRQAKRTNRKTFENEPVKPLETHEYPLPSQQSHAAMTSSWRATYRQTREVGHGIFHIMRAMDMVGSSCARGSRFNQSEESICWPITGEYMLTNQSEGARDSTNQSLPPGLQRAVPLIVWKALCLHFSHFLQWHSTSTTSIWEGILERERQHSVELSKNASKRTCLGLKSLVADWLRETWRHEFLLMKQRVFKNLLLIGWNETNSLAYFLIWA